MVKRKNIRCLWKHSKNTRSLNAIASDSFIHLSKRRRWSFVPEPSFPAGLVMSWIKLHSLLYLGFTKLQAGLQKPQKADGKRGNPSRRCDQASQTATFLPISFSLIKPEAICWNRQLRYRIFFSENAFELIVTVRDNRSVQSKLRPILVKINEEGRKEGRKDSDNGREQVLGK